MKIWSVIPARGGSKGIPGKNIKHLGGYPLIAYSCAVSKQCKQISRTIVSTDSEEIGGIAETYGGEVPFLRPAHLAKDSSGDMGFVLHLLEWFQAEEGEVPDYLVHLRPTTPLRSVDVIHSAILDFCDPSSNDFTSLRSVHELPESPYKMFKESKDRTLVPYIDMDSLNGDEAMEITNRPRQEFVTALVPNGYVDILDVKHILKCKTLHGPRIMSFVTKPVIEIDTIENFEQAEFYVKNNPTYQYLERLL